MKPIGTPDASGWGGDPLRWSPRPSPFPSLIFDRACAVRQRGRASSAISGPSRAGESCSRQVQLQSPNLLGSGVEETMIQRLIPSGVAAAIAGGTMAVALSCCPSFAFTLSAPSLAQSAVKADVQQVQYYDHHYDHPHYHHPYHHAYHHPYHYDHYDNPNRVRHYVPKTNAYHNY